VKLSAKYVVLNSIRFNLVLFVNVILTFPSPNMHGLADIPAYDYMKDLNIELRCYLLCSQLKQLCTCNLAVTFHNCLIHNCDVFCMSARRTLLKTIPFRRAGVRISVTFYPLRPVYRGDFCRGNSMQFLSRQNCIKFQTCSKPLRYRGDKSQ